MAEKRDGGPAFPGPHMSGRGHDPGMTLRQWYAGQALAGIAATNILTAQMGKDVAALAHALADAMLEARDG